MEILTSLANFFGVEVQWLIQDSEDSGNSGSLTSKKLKQQITELLEMVDPKELPKILAIIRVFLDSGKSK